MCAASSPALVDPAAAACSWWPLRDQSSLCCKLALALPWLLAMGACLIPGMMFLQIKIICSSGGHFQKMTGGGMEYVGGETRLISVASTCNFTELSAALDRVTGSLTIHSGQSIASGSDSVSAPLAQPLSAVLWHAWLFFGGQSLMVLAYLTRPEQEAANGICQSR